MRRKKSGKERRGGREEQKIDWEGRGRNDRSEEEKSIGREEERRSEEERKRRV